MAASWQRNFGRNVFVLRRHNLTTNHSISWYHTCTCEKTSHLAQLCFQDETLVQCIHLGLPTNRQHTPKVSEKAPTAAAFLFSMFIEAMSVAVSWGSNIQEEKRVEATAWTKKNHQDVLRIKYWAKNKKTRKQKQKAPSMDPAWPLSSLP